MKSQILTFKYITMIAISSFSLAFAANPILSSRVSAASSTDPLVVSVEKASSLMDALLSPFMSQTNKPESQSSTETPNVTPTPAPVIAPKEQQKPAEVITPAPTPLTPAPAQQKKSTTTSQTPAQQSPAPSQQSTNRPLQSRSDSSSVTAADPMNLGVTTTDRQSQPTNSFTPQSLIGSTSALPVTYPSSQKLDPKQAQYAAIAASGALIIGMVMLFAGALPSHQKFSTLLLSNRSQA